MQLAQLADKILSQINKGESISSSDWPDRIILDDKTKKSVSLLAKYTHPRNSKKEKPSGWEYEQSIFFFEGELFQSEVITGDYQSVKPVHSFNANPEYNKDKTKYFFNINIDKKKYKTKEFLLNEMNNRKFNYGFILSLHSHPKRTINNKSIYSFFSLADIKSLIYGRSPMLGLVAGKSLWVVCKTSNTTIPNQQILNQASQVEYAEGIEGVKKFIKQELNSSNLVFYFGSFNSILKKI